MGKNRRTGGAGKTKKQGLIRIYVEGIILIELMGALFFQLLWIRGLLLIALPLYVQYRRGETEARELECYKEKIRDMLQSLSGAMQTGYSLENSWKEVYREMSVLYGKEDRICLEIQRIIGRLQTNEPVERVIADFAADSDVEDLLLFSDVVQFAKRGGGNFPKIIRETVVRMTEKSEVDQEIRTLTAGKRMEQRIMSLMPAGILLYLRLASPGYLDVMYQTTPGILVMSICLCLYVAAYIMGAKITEIQV